MEIDWEERLGVVIHTPQEVKKIIRSSTDYYVYILWKRYTSIPVPFYVGKGREYRILQHVMPSEEKSNYHKTNIIKKHKKLKIEIGYSICNFFKEENKALKKEIDLIDLIGRSDVSAGPLANKSDGGDGSLGHLAPKGGDSASAKPVIANQIRYSCVKDAAVALDITDGAVTNRIKSGWPGYYFKDEGQRPRTKPVLGRYRKSVVVEGKQFESASDAMRTLGMDVRMISKRINYGWEGYYYIDQGQLPRKTVWGSREDKVSVIIHGKHYATTADAARETGEKEARIRKRCLSSNFPKYSRKDGKEEQKAFRPKFQEGVQVGSKKFRSQNAAARAFNLNKGTVPERCRSGNYPDWKFTDVDKQKRESFTPVFSSNPVSVTIDDKRYASQSSAASHMGVDISTLKQRCRSPAFPTWKCEGIQKVVAKDGKPSLIGVEILDNKYRSINQASKALGIQRPVIKKRLESDEWPAYQFLNH